jgi:hypothetical protein
MTTTFQYDDNYRNKQDNSEIYNVLTVAMDIGPTRSVRDEKSEG